MKRHRLLLAASLRWNSYKAGLEHWQETLTLAILIMSVSLFVLSDAGLDDWLLKLLLQLGSECSWCTVVPQ